MMVTIVRNSCDIFQLVFGFVFAVTIEPILEPGIVPIKATKKKIPISVEVSPTVSDKYVTDTVTMADAEESANIKASKYHFKPFRYFVQINLAVL
mmetsp:Transcript_76/g.112  ORF Transcript_76/g.112 Transcript_76/m.112 type:complete len:95 (-) Transcript_76:463-747(-)